MISSYFDAAGGQDHGFTAVAGYVARLWKWEEFETVWSSVLNKNHVPYFHMKEFAHSKGVFADWKNDEPRRRRFLSELVEVISTYAEHGIACVAEHRTMDELDREFEFKKYFPYPYVLAARDCIAHVNNYAIAREWLPKHQVEYVFDRGDQGKGALVEMCEKFALAIPSFKPSRDDARTGEKGIVQLQASDFAAYELRKAFADLGEFSPIWQYREPLRKLAQIDGEWGQYGVESLVKLCEAAGIPRRTKGL